MKNFLYQLFFLTSLIAVVYESKSIIDNQCTSVIDEVLANYFGHIAKDTISISPLTGGHSNISLLITAQNMRYVLRIKKEPTSIVDLKREIYVMKEAALRGISPRIYYISNDSSAVLMEYIKDETMSIAQSKEEETIKKVAQALAVAHSMPPNPYFVTMGLQSVTEIYNAISYYELIKPWLDQAFKLILSCSIQLAQMNAALVTDHGELNPRNIFILDNQAKFIDWEYTSKEDPFMDISYLSMRLDYTAQEELLFLEYYLQRPPLDDEIKRYYLAKKLNYAQLVIYFFSFALRDKEIEKCEFDHKKPLKSWAHYVKIFADKQDEGVSKAQFNFELARACLEQALAM